MILARVGPDLSEDLLDEVFRVVPLLEDARGEGEDEAGMAVQEAEERLFVAPGDLLKHTSRIVVRIPPHARPLYP
jgi:hypothetical protein